tara:strand:- start:1576 stop:1779 length:204 start_codon:yes stop_codon:yes gene_type:complete
MVQDNAGNKSLYVYTQMSVKVELYKDLNKCIISNHELMYVESDSNSEYLYARDIERNKKDYKIKKLI